MPVSRGMIELATALAICLKLQVARSLTQDSASSSHG
jgi:hypothetical protein